MLRSKLPEEGLRFVCNFKLPILKTDASSFFGYKPRKEQAMSVYLVTYDLNKETKRPNIAAYLKKQFPSYAMLSQSSYAVESFATATDVRKSFDHLLDNNDQIYVIQLSSPWAGIGYQLVNDWLIAKLGPSYSYA